MKLTTFAVNLTLPDINYIKQTLKAKRKAAINNMGQCKNPKKIEEYRSELAFIDQIIDRVSIAKPLSAKEKV